MNCTNGGAYEACLINVQSFSRQEAFMEKVTKKRLKSLAITFGRALIGFAVSVALYQVNKTLLLIAIALVVGISLVLIHSDE